jgi:D-alanyl-lipoteichoic acid acyltransferase DltB (MBOAT superfamily)
MLFNSIEFLLFIPIVYILYWFILKSNLRWQNILVLVSSYLFYGWWSWKFMLLLVLSTCIDFIYGFYVASPNRKRAKIFLYLSILNNLGILGIFKYYNFFVTQFQQGIELFGLHTNLSLLNVALPIGISFYTFHGMSYVFDIYRGKQKPVSSFVEYAVFVSFFPLLVAGPIERATHLLPQVQNRRLFNYSQSVQGCRLILWGMFKKIVIADSLASIANEMFSNYQNHNSISLIIGAIAFSFQIYGDFSGYSDIALGTAKLFGFELLSNFKFPYFSRDIAEFWRKWHISLSSWFRDYLYIPLGGSKNGKIKAVRNTFIIFLVSGFWHGASWNYIVWGGIHACGFLPLLLLNRNRNHLTDVVAHNRKFPNLAELIQILTTFTFVTFAWIFFRANDLDNAFGYIQNIFIGLFKNPIQILHPEGISVFIYIIPLVIGDWCLRRNERNLEFKYKIIFYILYLVTFFYFFDQIVNKKNASFIYFQF